MGYNPKKTEEEAREHFAKWANTKGTDEEFDLEFGDFEEYRFIFETWKQELSRSK